MRLLLDVDGLFADWCKAVCQAVKTVSGMHVDPAKHGPWMKLEKLGLDPDHLEEVQIWLNEAGFILGLPELPGGRAAVQAMRKLGVDITYVSAPWYANWNWYPERRKWLEERKLLTRKDSFIAAHARDKKLVRGDMFVDDRLETVAEWQEMNPAGQGVHWVTDWHTGQLAPGKIIQTGDWGRLLEVVQQCMKITQP